MKIKKSSWHCRFNTFDEGYHRKNDNLCSYFWRLVFKIAIIISGVGFISIFSYFILTDICLFILVLFTTLSCILPPTAIYFLRKWWGKPMEIPGSNIVIEYLKAKKEKVCPLIEYI